MVPVVLPTARDVLAPIVAESVHTYITLTSTEFMRTFSMTRNIEQSWREKWPVAVLRVTLSSILVYFILELGIYLATLGLFK